jgi:hypothetical protein
MRQNRRSLMIGLNASFAWLKMLCHVRLQCGYGGALNLPFFDLPSDVRKAYLASAAQLDDVPEELRAVTAIEAIAVVDNPNGAIYTTRNGGQNFAVEKIAETINIKRYGPSDNSIIVRRIIRIS